MNEVAQDSFRNRLIRMMSPQSFEALKDVLECAQLPRGFKLTTPGTQPEFAYFLESGIASIVAYSPEGQHAEIGVIGRDGMSPASLALDADTDPYSVFMQVPGDGFRVPVPILSSLLVSDRQLHNLLSRYAQTVAIQAGFTALSNAVHRIDERLARWILMCHDRTDGDEISLTHEFLSIMLAVRRPSVTNALHELEGRKLIFSGRGVIIVRDRAGLEAFASDAYGDCEKEYERLVGARLQ